jgi:hypothetical protein
VRERGPAQTEWRTERDGPPALGVVEPLKAPSLSRSREYERERKRERVGRGDASFNLQSTGYRRAIDEQSLKRKELRA